MSKDVVYKLVKKSWACVKALVFSHNSKTKSLARVYKTGFLTSLMHIETQFMRTQFSSFLKSRVITFTHNPHSLLKKLLTNLYLIEEL